MSKISWKSLQSNSKYPCFIVEYEQLRIMVDCALQPTTRTKIPTNLKYKLATPTENYKAVSAIIISSYKTSTMLPYITEHTEFSGRIFATTPTIEFAQLAMMQIINDIVEWNIEKSMSADLQIELPYSEADVLKCISRIEHISLNDPKVITS